MARNNGLTQRAREAGLTYDVVKCRLYRGWTMHDALTTPVKRVEPHDLKRQAYAAGLKYDTVYRRVHRWGWALDRALSTPAVAKFGIWH
jgi:transposase InsO family protein